MIEKGAPWGAVTACPADVVVVDDDAALGRLVADARRGVERLPPVAVRGGDLARTLGAPAWAPTASVTRLPVDVVRIEAAGDTSWAVAHAVARRGWWRGEVVAVMNAQYVRDWDVAPRSHPNDGSADVVRVSGAMRLRDRWQARRRLPTGAHVPHPAISARRVPRAEIAFDRPLDIWIDGVRWRRASEMRAIVEPDALDVCVPLPPG